MSESLGVSGSFDSATAGAAARNIMNDQTLSEHEKIQEIIKQVFHGNTALAMENWNEVMFGIVNEEEKKRVLELYVVSVDLANSISSYDQKHSNFFNRLHENSLFQNEGSFFSDFKLFEGATDDWLKILEKDKNGLIPEAKYVQQSNDLTRASLEANHLVGGAEKVEERLRAAGADCENNNALKMCYRSEALERMHQLDLIGDPCKCKSKAEIQKYADFLGVSLEDLNGMTLSTLKERVQWVKTYDEMAKDKTAYQEFMKNTDPRLDKFRDKDFSELSRAERVELAQHTKDIAHENRTSQMRVDLEAAGIPKDKIDQYIAEASKNKTLFDGAGYTSQSLLSWTDNISKENVKDMDPALRGQIKWDMQHGQGGFVEGATYSKILNNMQDTDFQGYAKQVLGESATGDRAQDTNKLKTLYDESAKFRADTSQKLNSSVDQVDKENASKASTRAERDSVTTTSPSKSLFDFWKPTPANMSPIESAPSGVIKKETTEQEKVTLAALSPEARAAVEKTKEAQQTTTLVAANTTEPTKAAEAAKAQSAPTPATPSAAQNPVLMASNVPASNGRGGITG